VTVVAVVSDGGRPLTVASDDGGNGGSDSRGYENGGEYSNSLLLNH